MGKPPKVKASVPETVSNPEPDDQGAERAGRRSATQAALLRQSVLSDVVTGPTGTLMRRAPTQRSVLK